MEQTPFVQPLPPQPPYPYYPPVNPIAGPVKVIGIIYAVFAALTLIGVLVMAAMGGMIMQGLVMPLAQHSIEGPLMLVLSGVVLLIAILEGVTAYGLLARKPWGRILAIIVSILSLLSVPLGTVLGAFGLYFLMRQGAEQDWDRLTLGQV
jgi:hypothetical protein